MIPVSIRKHISSLLRKGGEEDALELLPVGGGSINLAYELLLPEGERFFCKINSVSRYPAMFEKEKRGLEIIASENRIRVPRVVLSTVKDDYQILVLEWIEQGPQTGLFWKRFGEGMAALHYASSTRFGFTEDNYMGALPQSNQQTGNWSEFFFLHRLMPMVQMAHAHQLFDQELPGRFEALYKRLPEIFPPEIPSLLHGDLWSGNFLCDENENPVLVDPAVYYGHRSMDLAMTTLFGGFDRVFYEAYQHQFPFPANYREQWEICNLYPLLVHLNLFGKSYLPDIIRTIRRY